MSVKASPGLIDILVLCSDIFEDVSQSLMSRSASVPGRSRTGISGVFPIQSVRLTVTFLRADLTSYLSCDLIYEKEPVRVLSDVMEADTISRASVSFRISREYGAVNLRTAPSLSFHSQKSGMDEQELKTDPFIVPGSRMSL